MRLYFSTLVVFLLLFTFSAPLYAQPGLDNGTRGKAQEMRERYQKSLQVYEREKRGLENLSPDSDQFLNRAKERIKASINVVIRHWDLLETRIQESNMPAEQKTELLAKINDRKTYFVESLNEIEAIESLAELRDFNANLRSEWAEQKTVTSNTEGLMRARGFSTALEKFENVYTRLEARIKSLEDEGADVADLKELLSGVEDEIQSAEESHEQALEAFDEAEATGSNETSERALELLSQSREHLQAAHSQMASLVSEMKGFN